MPLKPKKVQGAGVGIFVDGKILSRLQSFTADSDLGVEEIRELTNRNVVEFVEGIPTVTVQMEANQRGSRHNLAALTGQPGVVQTLMASGSTAGFGTWREITPFSFDGTSVDIIAQVEEDSVLKRSMYIGGAFLTQASFSYDVGGVATESYTLEADNKVWYLNAQRELMLTSGYYNNVVIASGVIVTPHPDLINNGYFTNASNAKSFTVTTGEFTPLFLTKNNVKIINPATGAVIVPQGITHATSVRTVVVPGDQSAAIWSTQISGAGRFRVVGYKNAVGAGPNTVITMGTTDTSDPFLGRLGGTRKGMVQIFLTSGATWMVGNKTDNEEFLRLQTCSIDADLSREGLDELGNFQSFDRALNFPISVTVNFSALDSDLQAWAGFSNKRAEYEADTLTSVEFRDFVQNAGVLIKVFDDDESNVSRKCLMTITVSGVRVASESYSVDAGGNAVQEFSCSSDNFTIS